MKIDFCAIAPTKYLSHVSGRPVHLVLAPIAENDPEYAAFYKQEAERGSTVILDNGAFELYSAGLPMYDGDKLIEIGELVGAEYIVTPDFPGEAREKTLAAFRLYGKEFRNAGFKTFFCPQGRDLVDLIKCYDEVLLTGPTPDYVAFSILNVPLAFDVEKVPMQKFLARWHFFQFLGHEWFHKAKDYGVKIHFLGMTEGPNEIRLIKQLCDSRYYVDSWDSSGPMWAAINGIRYDNSPTGLKNGKFELPVDFSHAYNEDTIDDIVHNLIYVDYLCQQ